MSCLASITKNLTVALAALHEGRIVALPTGTSYGLAADTIQGWALQRLRNLKGRPLDKSFTIFLDASLTDRFLELTHSEQELCLKFAGRPLTVLVKPKPALVHLAAENGLVGLRLIDHPLMAKLAENYAAPLTATSANYAGGQPCFSPDCIHKTFPGLLPDERLGETDPRGVSDTTYDLSLACIFDGGILPTCPPSTIVRLTSHNNFEVVRAGALTVAEIKKRCS